MDDDFGTPAGLAVVFDLVREANVALDAGGTDRAATAHATVCDLAGALGLNLASDEQASDDALTAEVEKMLDERDEARKAKDFASADRIRDELAARGIVLEDTPGGTIWRET